MDQNFPIVLKKGLQITNIKFSVKIDKEWKLKELHEHCSALINNHCRLMGSKIVIRVPNQAKRIIVFPKKKGFKQHVNFTGISGFDEIENALNYACEYLNCEKENFLELKVENLWSKSLCLIENMRRENVTSLNLRSLVSVLNQTFKGADVHIRFRPEIFSAIVLRAFNATTLIYSTGSVIIVGAKNYSSLEKITELLSTISPCLVSNLVLTVKPLKTIEQEI